MEKSDIPVAFVFMRTKVRNVFLFYIKEHFKMKKMTKKIMALMIACVMLAAVCIGCGAKAEEENGFVTRVGSLKGPTTMGLANMISEEQAKTDSSYSFTMETQADVILGQMVQGELDIALVPANVAAVLYQKTEGGISVIDINTLGVLYLVSGDTSVSAVSDLEGRTIYLTGKGTSPDLVLRYVLAGNGLTTDDVTLEYKSEATEVAAVLAENPDAIGLLPQPFVTAACIQNESLSVIMDMTKEWESCSSDGSSLVTGVTVATKDYIENHPKALKAFMEAQKASAEKAVSDTEGTAEIIASLGIVEKAPVAAKALPACNIVYIDSTDMKTALSGYLNALYGLDPASVGGELPGDDFYYTE